MRLHTSRLFKTYFVLVIIQLFIVISCSKDSDLFSDSYIDKQSEFIEEQSGTTDETTEEEEVITEEETVVEEESEIIVEEEPITQFENRISDFFVLNDAHLQEGTVFNQSIVRLEENTRTSYLMFDLSPIDSIAGEILEANLLFTINSDNGSGHITINKGDSNNWSENSNASDFPEVSLKLGELTKEYTVGTTEKISLDASQLSNGKISLILVQESGNDLAFASKEHPSNIGSSLEVIYQTHIDAEEIIIPEIENTTIENPITQNTEPIAVADATPSVGGVPLEVSFNGSNSTDDNSIVEYSWDFKDGSTSDLSNPSHIFTEIGTYQVELTVLDEEGLSSTDIVEITVNEQGNTAPIAEISASTTSGDAPLVVIFNGSNSTDDYGISSYLWTFEDGSTDSNANPTHTFNDPGDYNVELQVTDEHGLISTKNITIVVNAVQNNAPTAVASASILSGEAPLTVSFTGNNSTDDNGITSYYWNFPIDPSSAPNAIRTFNSAGIYEITLSVEDEEGLSDSTTLTITVSEGSTTSEPEPEPEVENGYFVTTSGSSNNSGLSESSAWSLEHALDMAEPGDIIYVKAGNYGNKELITRNSGYSYAPIKFIGYTSSPGDITSTSGPTFDNGDSGNPNLLPLLSSTGGVGTAITVHDSYVHFENFQINGYRTAIQSNSAANYLELTNLLITNTGSQNTTDAYDGFGLSIRGNYSTIENCLISNVTAQAISLIDSDYSLVKNCEVYTDNPTNPTDYYYILSSGTSNSRVESSLAERAIGLSHGGHGFNVKDDASYNTFYNCTANRTSFEFTYSEVHHNTISGGSINGVNTDAGQWHARLAIIGGAHHNTIKNLSINNTWAAISWTTFNDKTGADANIGNDNVFENLTVNNTNRLISVGGGTNYNAMAKRNIFNNCNITNFNSVAVTYYGSEDIEFNSCSFNTGNHLIIEADGSYQPYSAFDASWNNCTWQNVNFTPPN